MQHFKKQLPVTKKGVQKLNANFFFIVLEQNTQN